MACILCYLVWIEDCAFFTWCGPWTVLCKLVWIMDTILSFDVDF